MNQEWIQAFAALADRFVTLANEDDALRGAIRALAQATLAATDRPATPLNGHSTYQAPHPPHQQPAAPSSEPPPTAAATPEPEPSPREPLPPLILGRAPGQPTVLPPTFASRNGSATRSTPAPTPTPTPADFGLADIEARCRLMADAITWSVKRRVLIDQQVDFRDEVRPIDDQFIVRGRELQCFLWMCKPEFPIPSNPAALEELADWFNQVAESTTLMRNLHEKGHPKQDQLREAAELLAESQSALRVALGQFHITEEKVQSQVYQWLCQFTKREKIYLARHMRLNDPADPAQLNDFKGRLAKLKTQANGVEGQAGLQKSALNRLKYHARLITNGSLHPTHDWQKVVQAVDELLALGVPPSNTTIRELVLPIVEWIPDELPSSRGFDLVLREIDQYLAGLMLNTPSEPAVAELPNEQVQEVAKLLNGTTVLLIGGVPRPGSKLALLNAFGLRELIWRETREHEWLDVFIPDVERPEVTLVLLAIRWTSHSYGGVKEFCDFHGKPMVRLPGGYGVNQVAAQILGQASHQLAFATE